MILKKKKQFGVGLIEVLIATVVIALGLLAVASMQGTFLSSSGESKTRAEALVIAERQMELLRNMMQVGDFTNLPVPTSPVNEVNASFNVGQVVSAASSPDRKQITLTVSWDGGGADKQIVLTSELLFSDPKSSVSLSEFGESGSGGVGQSPNPNQNASESAEQQIELFESDGATLKAGLTLVPDTSNLYTTTDGDMYRDDGNNKTGTLAVYCSDLGASDFDVDLINPANYPLTYQTDGTYTTANGIMLLAKRVDLDGISGNESIELYTQNYNGTTADGTCTLQHRYFGGVIIPIKGTVHTLFDLDDIKIDFNKEDMFCAFNPKPNGDSIKSGPYACYVGGNCASGPNGSDTDFTTCPSTAIADAKVGLGGFRGNIGLLNIDDDGGGKESVCFGDELAGTNTVFSTARKYKTLNSGIEQGINQSFTCQDFFIVGRQANVSRLAAECTAKVGTLNLPPKEVVRSLTNAANTVATTNTSYCSPLTPKTYTLTGIVSEVTGTLTVTANGNSCTLSGNAYTCSGTTTGTSIQVNASTPTQTGSCTATGLTTNQATGSCDIALTIPPVYSLIGQVSGVTTNKDLTVIITDGLVSHSCNPAQGIATASYSCSISTNESSIRVEVENHRNNAACTILGLTGEAGEVISLPSTSCTFAF
ncbi:MAG: hypothetical protein P1P78_05760 [Methyloprofundus sp.]|nr:hypothetical protein [Methyloprofundus sp.]